MNAPHQGGEVKGVVPAPYVKAPAVRLPVRLKSGGTRTPEKPQVVSTDAGLLDLESRWNAPQGVSKGIGENMKGLTFEQAQPLEERLATTEDEVLVLEARISEAPAEGLIGVAVKLRLLDFYRDLETQDADQQEICTRTALEAVERLLIGGANVG